MKEARAELKKVGTLHASGDALAFMFARCIVATLGFQQKKTEEIYTSLAKLSNDEQIKEKAKAALLENWWEFDVKE